MKRRKLEIKRRSESRFCIPIRLRIGILYYLAPVHYYFLRLIDTWYNYQQQKVEL